MKLCIYIDGDDLTDVAQAISASLLEWIEESGSDAQFVDRKKALLDDASQHCRADWDLGVDINIDKKSQLKEPLNKLYAIAKKNKSEFVIGVLDESSGECEDVCFFGHEEGRPDVYEVANYLGL
jgi:hypothetical protein